MGTFSEELKFLKLSATKKQAEGQSSTKCDRHVSSVPGVFRGLKTPFLHGTWADHYR